MVEIVQSGSLLLRTLFRLSDADELTSAFVCMPNSDMMTVACSVNGSFVCEALIKSPTVNQEYGRQFVEQFVQVWKGL